MVKSRGARNCQKSGAWNLLDNWQRPYVSQKRQRHDQICLRSSAGWWWRYFWHHWVTGNCSCLPLQSDASYCWGICSFVNTDLNSYSVKCNHRCCMTFENIITFILTTICSQYLCNWSSEEERVEQWTGIVDNCAIYFTDSSLASKVISGELNSGGVSQWKRVISLRECERVPWFCNFFQHFVKFGWCLFSFSSVDQKRAVT